MPKFSITATAKFILSAAQAEQFPNFKDKPEIAFIGRSNVGKSSLINALTNKKGLAKTSNTPGRTRQLNFFAIDNEKLILVDMPGYGYAKMSQNEIRKWEILSSSYFQTRQNLKKVFLLIDSRRGIMNIDDEIMELFDKLEIPFQIILTKSDKISKKELEKLNTQTQNRPTLYHTLDSEVIATSSSKKIGLLRLRARITELVN